MMGAQLSSAAAARDDAHWVAVNALTALSAEFVAAEAPLLEDDAHAASLAAARQRLHDDAAALAKLHPAAHASLATVPMYTCNNKFQKESGPRLRVSIICLLMARLFASPLLK